MDLEKKLASESYQNIIKVATEQFYEKGYEQSTVRDIAALLGVKSGSLYNHITNKQEILYIIIMQVGEEFMKSAFSALSGDQSSIEKINKLIRNHFLVIKNNIKAVTVYYQEWRKLDVEFQEKIISLRKKYEELLKEVIKTGMEKGELTNKNLNMMVLTVLSIVNWAYQWYTADGEFSEIEIADQFTDIIINGFKERGEN